MKIAYISPGKIYNNDGGGIGSRRLFLPLKNEENILLISSDINANLKLKKNKVKDIFSRFLGKPNYIFFERKKVILFLKQNNIKKIILDGSRMGFLVREIKKEIPDAIVITSFNNIEYDYLEAYALKYKGIIKNIFIFLEKKAVYSSEKESLKYSDKLVFLTKRDVERAKELYKFTKEKKYEIIPILLNRDVIQLKRINDYVINLVFTGSLSYGSNIHALKWFLENVWHDILKKDLDVNFIIAGSNPSDKFLKYLKNYQKVEVCPNFGSLEEVVPKNSVFLSPIMKGAGMKIKVADALSMNLPIIASEESLVGYEKALEDIMSKNVIFKFNSKNDLLNIIEYVYNNYNKINVNSESRKLFDKYYNLNNWKIKL
jgi:hypothetical protein